VFLHWWCASCLQEALSALPEPLVLVLDALDEVVELGAPASPILMLIRNQFKALPQVTVVTAGSCEQSCAHLWPLCRPLMHLVQVLVHIMLLGPVPSGLSSQRSGATSLP
jgi:hypothetical protein